MEKHCHKELWQRYGPISVSLTSKPWNCQSNCPIANSRLIRIDEGRVFFKWKDYRAKQDNRYKTMSLETTELIRRFLIHVLPKGFHRIRHYGLFANSQRLRNIATARALLRIDEPLQLNQADKHALVLRACT